MKITVFVMKDIRLRPRGHLYFAHMSHVDYDAKSTVDKKMHVYYSQQGRYYGTVGDCCDYISHAKLIQLEADGVVKITGPMKRGNTR